MNNLEIIINNILNLKDLRPNKTTNKAFTDLCSFCINNDIDFKIDKKIKKLNEICASAEYEMEKYYSNKIIRAKNQEEEMQKFIYYNNYEKLVELEYLNLNYFKKDIKNILFIWWGPLPLSAIIWAKKYNINIDIIDNSLESVNISKKLINKLNLDDRINIKLDDARYIKTDKKYDLIYMANLIFIGWEQEIINNIKNIEFSYWIVRSSENSRKLLYKKLDENYLSKFFKLELIINPKNEIINSIIIFKKH